MDNSQPRKPLQTTFGADCYSGQAGKLKILDERFPDNVAQIELLLLNHVLA